MLVMAAAKVRYDMVLLVGVIKGSYLEQILSLLSGNSESLRELVCESVSVGA